MKYTRQLLVQMWQSRTFSRWQNMSHWFCVPEGLYACTTLIVSSDDNDDDGDDDDDELITQSVELPSIIFVLAASNSLQSTLSCHGSWYVSE